MSYIFSAVLIIVVIALVLWLFVNSNAGAISRIVKSIIPVSLMAIGIIATIAGRGQYGIPAIGAALVWWYYWVR